jgi:hypothetical protein
MRRLVLIFLAFCCMGLSDLGQTFDCSNFRHNEDGSWTPLSQITITIQNGSRVSMGPGVSFRPGVQFSGIDIAELLNQKCISTRE